jgi:hypothetical protein
MMMSACVDRLMALGYELQLGPEGKVRVSLPGGLPPPPQAAPLLAHIKAHRENLREELRFRARSTERFVGRQTKIKPPMGEEGPESKPSKAERLRTEIDALLEYAWGCILEMTEEEKNRVNDRFLVLSCSLRNTQSPPDELDVF